MTPWRLVVACAALVYAQPLLPWTVLGTVASNAAGVLPAVVAVVAAWRTPGWLAGRLIALGLVASAVADIAYSIVLGIGVSPTVSLVDAIYLAYYALMLAGMVLLVRSRTGQRDSGVWGDGVAIAVAAALLSWQFLVVDTRLISGLPVLERVVLAAYPIADTVLVAGLAWLLLAPGRRSPALWLLVAHFASMLVADVLFALIGDAGSLGAYVVNPLYGIGYAFAAGALIHPSVASLARPDPQPRAAGTLHPARIAFLGVALFVAPIVAIIDNGRGGGFSNGVFLVVSATLTGLVLGRMRSLVRHTQRAEATLAHQATHDALTGLPNRPLLIDRLSHALAYAQRRPGQTCVLYLDVDRFKIVNDTMGHAAGDRLLVEVARRLERCGRAGDTVARLGGDEFVLLCEDVAGVDEATRIADRVIEALGSPIPVLDEHAHVSASVGIALHTGPTDTPESLLRDADAAMYRAKRAGRGRWELFDSDMRVRLDHRIQTETALRRAVERDELRLLYQPQVDIRSGEVVGCEALVRWERPGHGTLTPDQFISIADEVGLISEVGAWVLERACRQLARWNDARLDQRPITMSVNVSGRQLDRPGFAALVAGILARSGVDPTCLILEITESALIHDPSSVLARLESLRSTGVALSIDDFGTGYSSLEYLRRYPLDEVKIAPVFVTELSRLGSDATIAAAVIALARALGYRSTAEGVETAEQLAALAALGCDRAQGYLFARPLPVAEIDALFARRAPISV